ncbi:hypothetical protein ABW19_dt0204826 [Dactylella cylindrospora]|nr:hypothetical protein ABW19_dt0204826 [Dactylella cylindrospora]
MSVTPQMMLLSMQQGEDLTWSEPRQLFLKITGNEEPATTPIEIAKTLTRLPYNVRERMLDAIDSLNKRRQPNQIWTIANLWVWSKKTTDASNDDETGPNDETGLASSSSRRPDELLEHVIACLTLAPTGNEEPRRRFILQQLGNGLSALKPSRYIHAKMRR